MAAPGALSVRSHFGAAFDDVVSFARGQVRAFLGSGIRSIQREIRERWCCSKLRSGWSAAARR
jgi:hypothetical protein